VFVDYYHNLETLLTHVNNILKVQEYVMLIFFLIFFFFFLLLPLSKHGFLSFFLFLIMVSFLSSFFQAAAMIDVYLERKKLKKCR